MMQEEMVQSSRRIHYSATTLTRYVLVTAYEVCFRINKLAKPQLAVPKQKEKYRPATKENKKADYIRLCDELRTTLVSVHN